MATKSKPKTKSAEQSKKEQTKTLTTDRIIAINNAVASVKGIKLASRTSFRLNLLIRAIAPHLEEYSNIRQIILTELRESGVPNKDDETKLDIPPEKKAEFEAKHQEILAEEHPLLIPEFKLSEFDGIDLPVDFFLDMGELVIED